MLKKFLYLIIFAISLASSQAAADQPLPPNSSIKNSSESNSKSRKEIVVRFKSSISESVASAQSKDNYQFSPKGLTAIEQKYGVRSLDKVFKVTSQTASSSSSSGNKQFENRLEQRKKRAPDGIKKPDLSSIYILKLDTDNESAIENAVKELRADPTVEWVERNGNYFTNAVPDDPLYSSNQISYFNAINVSQAWDVTKGSKNVVVGVIETGIDWQHSDLAANIWQNSGEIANDGIDNDQNGYIDDIRGWDFVSVSSSGVYSGEDGYPEDNDPMDFQGHGTHVAGIIGAVGNNGTGVTGVSWNVSLMPLRAGYKNVNGGGSLEWVDISQAIIYAADNGADIINMSFGSTSGSQLVKEALQYAVNAGVLPIAAAGNENNDLLFFPASYEHVVSVASLEISNLGARKSSFSTYGLWVDIAAPGTSIYSTEIGNQYGYKSGTSMASPMVAGLAALVYAAHPGWTSEQVANQLIATSLPIDTLNPQYYSELGSGMINANGAVGAQFAGPRLSIVNLAIKDSDDNGPSLDKSEIVELIPTIGNYGENATGVQVGITSSDPYIEILNSSILLGSIERYTRRSKTSDPLRVRISSSAPLNYKAKVVVNAVGGQTWSRSCTLLLAQKWSEYQQLTDNESLEYVLSPTLAGKKVLLYQGYSENGYGGINAKILDADGKVSTDMRVSSSVAYSEGVDAYTDQDSSVHVIYGENDGSGNRQIRYRKYEPVNGSWRTPVNVTTNAILRSSAMVKITGGSGNSLHILWVDTRSGVDQLYSRTYSNGTWQTEQAIASLTSEYTSTQLYYFQVSPTLRYAFWQSHQTSDPYGNSMKVLANATDLWSSVATYVPADPNSSPVFQQNGEIYQLYATGGTNIRWRNFVNDSWTDLGVLKSSYNWSNGGTPKLIVKPDGNMALFYKSANAVAAQERNGGVWDSSVVIGNKYFLSQITIGYLHDKSILYFGNNYDIVFWGRVFAGSGGGRVMYTTTRDFRNNIPGRSLVLVKKPQSADSVNISWTPPTYNPGAFYFLTIGTIPGKADVFGKYAVDSTSMTANLPSPLRAGQSYFANVYEWNNWYTGDLAWSDEFFFEKQSSVTGPFLESNGLLVMEAESYRDKDANGDNDTWIESTSLSGFSGASYMSASPDDESIAQSWSNGALMRYEFKVASPGTYTFWLRRNSNGNGASNSVYIGVDGSQVGTSVDNQFSSSWSWYKYNTAVYLTAGLHTLEIRNREDGYNFDKIVLTTSTEYNPAAINGGIGPQESLRETENKSPFITITSPTQNQTFDLGSTVNLAATASDSDGTVASVSYYINNALLLTMFEPPFSYTWVPISADTVVLTAVATDDKGASTTSSPVTIIVKESSGTGVFLEAGGLLVMETENFSDTSANGDNDNWITATTLPGYSGNGYMTTSPDNETSAQVWNNSAEMSFTFKVANSGVYTFWLRRHGNGNGGSNSCYIGIDGVQVGTTVDNQSSSSWGWFKYTTTTNLSQGTHNLEIRNREDGYNIDKIVLTNSTSYNPSLINGGLGPQESERDGGVINKLPSVVITSPAQNQSFTLGETVSISVSASDSDGTISSVEYIVNGTTRGIDYAAPYQIFFTPAIAGSYAISAVATDNLGGTTSSVPVNIVVVESTGAFSEQNGLLVMESENYSETSANGDNDTWTKLSDVGVYSGSGYMVASPDDETSAQSWSNGAEMRYNFTISTPGVYTIWKRRYGQGSASNSSFVGIDGTQVGAAFDNQNSSAWGWFKFATTISLTSGNHYFQIRNREDGYLIDKIVLTNNTSFNPSTVNSGLGPQESARN